jgi:hypothetical protein
MSLDLIQSSHADLEPISLLRGVLERGHLEGKRVISAHPFSRGEGQSVRFSEAIAFMAQGEELATQATTLISACHTLNEDIFLWITSDEQGVRFRYGISGPHSDVLNQLIESTLPGVQLKQLGDPSISRRFEEDRARLKTQKAAIITGLPNDRESHQSLVSLDEVLSGLAGQRFDLILQATPARVEEINNVTDELTDLINVMKSLESLSITQSHSDQFTQALSQAQTRAESESEQRTQTKSTSNTKNSNAPALIGGALGGLVGGLAGGPAGVAIGAQLGSSLGKAVGGTNQKQTSRSSSHSTSRTKTQSETRSETESHARSMTQSITLNAVCQQASMIVELAKEHLKRFQAMKSYGSWHTRVVLCAEDKDQLRLAGSLICASMRGDQSYLDPLRWLPIEEPREFLSEITTFPKFGHPVADYKYIPRGGDLSSFLASGELSLWFRPPQRQLYGLKLNPQVSFSTPMRRSSSLSPHGDDHERHLNLGQLMHEGRELKRIVKDHHRGKRVEPIAKMTLNRDDLTKHCFIAGTTGSGKTTTARRILLELYDQGIPFLVIEPAKTEYHQLFEELIKRAQEDESKPAPLRLNLTGLGPSEYTKKLSLNPWVAPKGVPLGRHVEGVKTLLRSCFNMDASLPQLLEALIFESYYSLGWRDLSVIVGGDERKPFPTFQRFLKGDSKLKVRPAIEKVFKRLNYEAKISQSLKTALTVRLESFCRGLKRDLFAGGDDLLFNEFLRRPIFIELNDLNEPDIRNFLIGALMLRLSAELEASHRANPQEGLRHVTLLEEAHHFLLEPRGSGPGADLARASNMLLANAFAEMRAYGEGIIVADQAPSDLSTAVLRNTNLKIAHRLLYERDCEAMGEAMGLSDEQMKQLRLLRPGQCVITTPQEPTPALCQIDQI